MQGYSHRGYRCLLLIASLLALAFPSYQGSSDSVSDSDSSADYEEQSSSTFDSIAGDSSYAALSFYGFYAAPQLRREHSNALDQLMNGPQRRSGTVVVPGRTRRQVAFTLHLPGVQLRGVIADSGEYAQLQRGLNDLLNEALGEFNTGAPLPRWYHKLTSSTDGSSLEVKGHLDFGFDVSTAQDFQAAYSAPERRVRVGSGTVGVGMGKVLGTEVTVSGVQVVSYPETATDELLQGQLPDRQTLLLEQLTTHSGVLTRRIDEPAVGSACMPNTTGEASRNAVGEAGMACSNRGNCIAGSICICNEGYGGDHCNRCSEGYVALGGRCEDGSALWGADLTAALAGGNYWLLEGAAHEKEHESVGKAEVAVPPRHVQPMPTPATNLSTPSLDADEWNKTTTPPLRREQVEGNATEDGSTELAATTTPARLTENATEEGAIPRAVPSAAFGAPTQQQQGANDERGGPHSPPAAAPMMKQNAIPPAKAVTPVEFSSPVANRLFYGAKSMSGKSKESALKVEDHWSSSHVDQGGMTSREGVGDSSGDSGGLLDTAAGTAGLACGITGLAVLVGAVIGVWMTRRRQRMTPSDANEQTSARASHRSQHE